MPTTPNCCIVRFWITTSDTSPFWEIVSSLSTQEKISATQKFFGFRIGSAKQKDDDFIKNSISSLDQNAIQGIK